MIYFIYEEHSVFGFLFDLNIVIYIILEYIMNTQVLMELKHQWGRYTHKTDKDVGI